MFSRIIQCGLVDMFSLVGEAVEASDSRFLEVLLAAGLSFHERPRKGTLLFRANDATFPVLVAQKGIDLNAVDHEGNILLHSLCTGYKPRSFRIKAVRLLVAAGVDLSAKDKKGQTALHVALRNDHDYDFAKALIVRGSHINAVDDVGVPVFDLCCSLAVLQLFISNGINVNNVGKYGNTPLHRVFFRGFQPTRAVPFLLDAGLMCVPGTMMARHRCTLRCLAGTFLTLLRSKWSQRR